MTPAQIALVETSFRHIAPLQEMAAAVFYQRLFAMDPGISRIFRRADMTAQGRKLMGAIGFAVDHLRRPERLLPMLEDLGQRHADYGVRPHHYGTVGTAFIATLEVGLGDAFTEELREAWVAAYRVISDTMQAGAVKAARAA
jgi:hemoglobin-like flavoprotein